MRFLLFLGWLVFLFLCIIVFGVFGPAGVLVFVLLVGGSVAIFVV